MDGIDVAAAASRHLAARADLSLRTTRISGSFPLIGFGG